MDNVSYSVYSWRNSNVYVGPHLNKNVFVLTHYLKLFGLKYEDYANLKWEDEPVEVFINMED